MITTSSRALMTMTDINYRLTHIPSTSSTKPKGGQAGTPAGSRGRPHRRARTSRTGEVRGAAALLRTAMWKAAYMFYCNILFMGF